MRALKVLVIVLGVLLVAGTIALAIAVVRRVEQRQSGVAASPTVAAPLRTALPPGAHIVAATLDGDRMMLRITLAGGGEEIRLYDARTGALVAEIDGAAAP